MKVDTTLNLKNDQKVRLDEASKKMGIRRSVLIIILLKKFIKYHGSNTRKRSRIEYQERIKENGWKRIHFSMLSRDYEYFLDLKKFRKCSLSFLVSISMDLYLEGVVDQPHDDSMDASIEDNQYIHYIVVNETIDNVICWKIFWGFPENANSIFSS